MRALTLRVYLRHRSSKYSVTCRWLINRCSLMHGMQTLQYRHMWWLSEHYFSLILLNVLHFCSCTLIWHFTLQCQIFLLNLMLAMFLPKEGISLISAYHSPINTCLNTRRTLAQQHIVCHKVPQSRILTNIWSVLHAVCHVCFLENMVMEEASQLTNHAHYNYVFKWIWDKGRILVKQSIIQGN